MNFVLACYPCNLAKSDRTGDEFLVIPHEEREKMRLAHLTKPRLEEIDE